MENNYCEYTYKDKLYKYHPFDKIENVDDAYFIGYMSSDGGYRKGACGSGCMQISSTEKYVIYAFRERYCVGVPVRFALNSSEKVRAVNEVASFNFISKMNETFNRFGIFCKKPERRMVGIPKKYFYSYLLGVLDADGCFLRTRRKDNRPDGLRIKIASSARLHLLDIQRMLELEGFSSSVYQRSTQNCYDLYIQNTKSVVEIAKRMYETFPFVYNMKKHSIYQKYVKDYYKAV